MSSISGLFSAAKRIVFRTLQKNSFASENEFRNNDIRLYLFIIEYI